MCKETAKHFVDSMNATADPCEDFWEFTCGAWRGKSIPDDKTSVWLFTEMEDRLDEQIRELLTRFNVESDGKKNSRAVTLAASVYQNCMKLNDNNEEGKRYIWELINEVIGSWTIGQKVDEHTVNKTTSWQKTLVQAMAKGFVLPVFSLGLYPDSKNSSVNDLWVSK